MNQVAAPTPHPHTLKRARPLLGTLVEISASGASEQTVAAAIERAFAAVETIQELMSYHDLTSDVSRLNHSGTDGITVDPHTWRVLDTARVISGISHGLFDISIAPELVHHGYLPQHAGLAHAEPAANWQDIELLPENRVHLRRPLHIDLGGIAKGYAVDCAIRTLQDAGMLAGRVNAGGDLRLFGDSAETIHVRHPSAATQLLPLCELNHGAIATSAPYYAGRQRNGRTISPLFDATTRQPCSGWRSVSVLADSCMLADALTKVVYADPAYALATLNRLDAHAAVLDADPDAPGGCRVRLSDPAGWRDALSHEPEAVAA
ncbi:MAG: FAD:protein FMN transferase [Thiobacillus sp.]